MERDVEGVRVEIVRGNIADQPDIDAVVNAANAELLPGGGVAGAVHRAAGPGLARECLPLGPIRPGESVITGAHGLPNRFVIHCLGPVYGMDEPSDELLASCYEGALRLAEENGAASIAFPAISTGAFGYPMEPAAGVALRTVMKTVPGLSAVRHVRFVLFRPEDVQVHERVLEKLT